MLETGITCKSPEEERANHSLMEKLEHASSSIAQN